MKFKKIFAIVACSLAISGTVDAAVIDSANVGSLTTFRDTNTGRIWLDMNNFFDATASVGTTGFDMIAIAKAHGFTIANAADLHQLLDSLPLTGGEWSSYAAVMGFGQPRNLIWGMYEGGRSPNYPWAWSFSTDSHWNFDGDTEANHVQNDCCKGAVDMGIWAYQAAPVPEPETYAMLLAGLGLISTMKRRQSRNLSIA